MCKTNDQFANFLAQIQSLKLIWIQALNFAQRDNQVLFVSFHDL